MNRFFLTGPNLQNSTTTITVTFDPQQVVTWLIIGLIAGFLANVVLRGSGRSVMSNIVIGLIGAVVGGFLFTVLGIPTPAALNEGITLRYIDIVISFIGALIVIALFGGLWRRRRID
ncbi:MAG: GlsB/YeaQ/YmgE family stress response membrane protein [Anaerolineaceae bacterium]|nr:GlsB/YeaQ/YmgE family stress response membrane protein [Anaerolineaceae bacterium]